MLLTEERKPFYSDKRYNQPRRDDSYELLCTETTFNRTT